MYEDISETKNYGYSRTISIHFEHENFTKVVFRSKMVHLEELQNRTFIICHGKRKLFDSIERQKHGYL